MIVITGPSALLFLAHSYFPGTEISPRPSARNHPKKAGKGWSLVALLTTHGTRGQKVTAPVHVAAAV
jgi:hypothetical protein